MSDHSDFFQLFSAYWWLIFPIGWGISQLVRVWSRQRQAEKAMDVIKSYTDQGKEPPAEILQLLQAPQRSSDPVISQSRERDKARGLMLTSFIFVALAVGFGVLMNTKLHDPDPDNHAGLLFVTVLMAGFAVAFFLSSVVLFRDLKRRDSL